MTKPVPTEPTTTPSSLQHRRAQPVTTPEQIRAALWYASHCCFCGFDYPAPHPYPFLADNKPHKRACYLCLWCGPAILDEIPVPPDWQPPTEVIH